VWCSLNTEGKEGAAQRGTLRKVRLDWRLLLAEGEEKFGRSDGLASVALGVVGDVDEEPGEGRGELLAADGAGLFEASRLKVVDPYRGVLKAGAQFVKDGLGRTHWLHF